MRKNLTIKDIADLANVSPSAVSIALNDRKGISDETRTRILSIIDRVGYIPNQQARRLLLKYTNNIGILYEKEKSPLTHWFLFEIISPAVTRCEELGYNFLFSSIQNTEQFNIPDIVKNRDVDGLIILGELKTSIIAELLRYGFPVVLVDEHMRTKDAYAIEADYEQGAELAVSYLIGRGHTRIAYIGENNTGKYGKQTLSGYRKALEKHHLDTPMSLVRLEARDAKEETAYACMEQILSSSPLPTAVFCAADIYSIGAMRVIKERDLRVPDDISVAGMDNIILGSYVEPGLTTVKYHKEQMGNAAIETLVSIIKGEYVGSKKLIFHGELVERSSVKSLR